MYETIPSTLWLKQKLYRQTRKGMVQKYGSLSRSFEIKKYMACHKVYNTTVHHYTEHSIQSSREQTVDLYRTQIDKEFSESEHTPAVFRTETPHRQPFKNQEHLV